MHNLKIFVILTISSLNLSLNNIMYRKWPRNSLIVWGPFEVKSEITYALVMQLMYVYAWAQPKWRGEQSSIHASGILNQPVKHFKENLLQLLKFMICIWSPTISQSPLTVSANIFPHVTVVIIEASWIHYCIFHPSNYYIP